ncbi:MAG: hypothetical protein KKA16_07390 [Alphaproteobacteria bacterium]|nr:hypothetical protein [Alphaproteobacteria bacterium]MBU2379661.1 hypothetical protein [Alphaproteobacteria bacterium]
MVESAGPAIRWNTVAVVPVVAIAICMLALLASSAESGTQVSPPPDPDAEARAITQMVTAAEVANWARDHRDPQAMIVAARMLGEIRTRRQDGDDAFLTPSALLQEAEAMAGSDAALLEQIGRLRSPDKGVRASPFGRGPIVVVRRLRARETYGFTVEARRHEVLRVAAIGDGDTNIDLALKGADGVVVCADGSRDHYPVCTLASPEGGPIRIEVVNRGRVWSRVQILTN